MKGFIIGVITAIAVSGGMAYAGLFSSFATSGWPTQPSTAFKVEAYGFDFRVYEWHPKASDNMTCTAGFTDNGPIGLQCFETPK